MIPAGFSWIEQGVHGILRGRHDPLYEIWGCFNQPIQRVLKPGIFRGTRGGLHWIPGYVS